MGPASGARSAPATASRLERRPGEDVVSGQAAAMGGGGGLLARDVACECELLFVVVERSEAQVRQVP